MPRRRRRCKGFTAKGTRCKWHEYGESGYCDAHQDQKTKPRVVETKSDIMTWTVRRLIREGKTQQMARVNELFNLLNGTIYED